VIRIPRHAPDLLEAVLRRLVLARLNALPGVQVWRMNVGAARDRGGRKIHFGVPGQADVSGLMAPSGRRLEVELKSTDGRQTPAQKQWQRWIEAGGGLYVLAKTLDQALVPVCEHLGLAYEVE
jgi:hypothetical protein